MAVDGQTEQLRGIKRKNTSSNSVVSRTLRGSFFQGEEWTLEGSEAER